MMKSTVERLLKRHQALIQSDLRRVTSHVQRSEEQWQLNTLLIQGCDTPFKYRRIKRYRDLTGQLVNITYYPSHETVAGIELDIMRVVRLKIA